MRSVNKRTQNCFSNKRIQPRNKEWIRLADLTLNLLLEKLAISTTKLLMDRMAHGQEYIVAEDENIRRKLRDLASDEYDELRHFGVDAVQVLDSGVKSNYTEDYTVNNDTITVYEMSTKLLMVLNPTRSDYLREIIHEQEDVREKLQKMGYECKTVLKKSERRRNQSNIKAQFKPRRFISSTTRNRFKRDLMWVPEVLRNLQTGFHGGVYNVPAVLIS